jgi:hypothetical protein
MNKIYCDWCNKVINDDDDYQIEFMLDGIDIELDLCRKCRDKLSTFIDNRGKN